MSSQMPSLTQAMEAISLVPPNPPGTGVTSKKIELPIPRRIPEAKDHRLIYGIVVTYEWLQDYCERNSHRIIGYKSTTTRTSKMYFAMRLIRESLRLQNLTIEEVVCNARDLSLELERTYPGSVPVLAVCNSMRSSYERRPNGAQLAKLRSITQREPDWYVDVNSPRYYGKY